MAEEGFKQLVIPDMGQYPELVKKYEYAPRPGWVLSSLLLSLLFGPGFLGLALTNNEPLDRLGMRLSPTQACVLYGVFSIVFFNVGTYTIILALFHKYAKQHITVTSRGIIIPKWKWSTAEIFVNYDLVNQIRVSKYACTRRMRIYHAFGSFLVSDAYLPQRSDFDEIHDVLVARGRGGKGTQHGGMADSR